MRLNGWRRLWIVIVTIYGIIIVLFAAEERPKLSNLELDWTNNATDVIARKITDKEGKEISSYEIRETLFKNKNNKEIIVWLENIAHSPSANQKIFSDSVLKINDEFKKEIEKLPEKQRTFYFQMFLWWMVPSICFYLFGWSVGWIVQGFKQK